MNILVVLRVIRDPAGFVANRKAQKIFVNRQAHLINPSDKNALEAALSLRGAEDRVAVVATGDAVTDDPAEDALRQARSMGADRAVLVRDTRLKPADASVVTAVLQRVVAYFERPYLILLGAEVLDLDMAQVGPRLAEALDWPFIEAAHELAVNGAAVTAVAHHPDGFHQWEADLPAVISVAPHSNKPRYSHGAQIVNLFRSADAVERLSLADLQISAADLTPWVVGRGESFPPERELGRRLEGSLEEMARQVADEVWKA